MISRRVSMYTRRLQLSSDNGHSSLVESNKWTDNNPQNRDSQ